MAEETNNPQPPGRQPALRVGSPDPCPGPAQYRHQPLRSGKRGFYLPASNLTGLTWGNLART